MEGYADGFSLRPDQNQHPTCSKILPQDIHSPNPGEDINKANKTQAEEELEGYADGFSVRSNQNQDPICSTILCKDTRTPDDKYIDEHIYDELAGLAETEPDEMTADRCTIA